MRILLITPENRFIKAFRKGQFNNFAQLTMNRLARLSLDRRLRPAGENGAAPIPPPRNLKTAADVLALLHEQVEAVRMDAELDPSERARLIGSLAAVALRAIETGNLEARLEMLEAVLKRRNERA